ncbi:MAG TPA: family 43 glycosylhydrolase, partial [Cellvibrionaceae bacterium]|nr:family 43 glycosylhydrolase [Cellvibrionaceae bacterium]
NIEGGAWTQTTLPNLYHDASLLLDDDGRAYLAYGQDDIRLIELNADLSGIKSGGVNQQIIAKASSVAGSSFILKAEGTLIQKINGWYYISNICWPSGKSRTQILHRARSITGPYEGRVVFQDQGIAQGEYVSTPDGKWYLYAFRDSGAVGRIPWLVPVQWQNDWPVAGVNGKAPQTLGFNVDDKRLRGIIRSDEFTNTNLDLAWQWNHNPDATGWSLAARPGFMRLTTTRTAASFVDARNSLTQRMFGPTSTGTIALDVSGMKDGDVAGLGALQSKYGFVGVTQTGSNRALVMVNAASGSAREVERVSLTNNRVYLRINGNFKNQADDATFYYSLDGTTWRQIGDTLQMSYELTHFMGYRFALFNYATKTAGGFVDFDYFRVSE